MTEFKITDAGVRTALEAALWHCAHDEMEGESASLSSTFSECGYGLAEERDITDGTESIDGTLEVLATLRAGVEQVRRAQLGATVDLTVDDDSFQGGLGSVIYSIENEFWTRPANERLRMLATRDAAVRVKAEVDAAIEHLNAVLSCEVA